MKFFATTLALALASTPAIAQQHVHQPGMVHTPGMTPPAAKPAAASQDGHGQSGDAKLKEPGQAAFAAIQEAVAVLEADPNTDWSKVSIETLRAHLIDMDNVVTKASVQMVELPNGARFNVTGAADIVPSIQRMVAGHSTAMTPTDDWKYVSAKTSTGATLEVTSPRAADAAKIRALSFAGMMARGSHHQPHHYGMTVGSMVH